MKKENKIKKRIFYNSIRESIKFYRNTMCELEKRRGEFPRVKKELMPFSRDIGSKLDERFFNKT